MSLPTKGEEFAKLIEFLHKAEEASAMLAHLHADESKVMSSGWLAVSKFLNEMALRCTDLATTGRLQ